MSRRRKIFFSLLAAVVIVLGGVVWYLNPIAPVATGYAAKSLCSSYFLQVRDLDEAAVDLPSNPLVPYLRSSADDSALNVTTTLLGAWGSTAWFTPGLGCTLADTRPDFTPLELPTADPQGPWPESNGAPEEVEAVDAEALNAAIDGAFVEDDPQGLRRGTRAVVVIVNGKLVAERYAEGFDAQTPLIGWSATKSIANAMTGRLVADGALTVDDPNLRPDWASDARATITVDDLLHMTDGLAFEEVYEPDTDATQMLFRPRDMGDFAADMPLTEEPGTFWEYSSGTTNILCDVLQDAVGSGPELARQLIFEPLGMTSAVMEPDISAGMACSSFTWATARDWARFGQWFLQNGEWEGEQLLPEDWVEYSTQPVEVVGDEGLSGYGAQWWLNANANRDLRMPSLPEDLFWASGHEGQHVVVIPSADVVVVRLGLSEFEGSIDWGLEPLLRGVLDAVE